MTIPLPGTVKNPEHSGFFRAILVHALNYHHQDWRTKDLEVIHEYKVGRKRCVVATHCRDRMYMFLVMHDVVQDRYVVQTFKSDVKRVWPVDCAQYKRAIRKDIQDA